LANIERRKNEKYNSILYSSINIFGVQSLHSVLSRPFWGGVNVLENPNFIIPTNKPRLIQGSDIEKDTFRMMEEGYVLLGVSYFNAGNVNQSAAVNHSAKVNADTVIVYSSYTGTISGSLPVTLPNTQTSYHSGSIYGTAGGFATYSGSSTTYGTQTTYMPYKVNRFDYYATFWIKQKQMALGIYFKNLTDELRRKIESNKGVYITVIVKKSPAYENDLLANDIIRKINNIEITDVEHFKSLLVKNKGQQIDLEIFRNDKTIVKIIQLN